MKESLRKSPVEYILKCIGNKTMDRLSVIVGTKIRGILNSVI